MSASISTADTWPGFVSQGEIKSDSRGSRALARVPRDCLETSYAQVPGRVVWDERADARNYHRARMIDMVLDPMRLKPPNSVLRWKQSSGLRSDRDCRLIVFERVARSFAQSHGRCLIAFTALTTVFDRMQGDGG